MAPLLDLLGVGNSHEQASLPTSTITHNDQLATDLRHFDLRPQYDAVRWCAIVGRVEGVVGRRREAYEMVVGCLLAVGV